MADDLLTVEQKRQLADALKQIPILRQRIADAKRAGLDVASLEAQLSDLEKRAKGIHSVYVAPPKATP